MINRLVLTFVSLLFWQIGMGQQKLIQGKVVNQEDGTGLPNVTLSLLTSGLSSKTNPDGRFALQISQADSLVLKSMGFLDHAVFLSFQDTVLTIEMGKESYGLQEVIINTGYYQLPAERATGSFRHLTHKELNRAVGSNIINRLEGLVEGLQFVSPEGKSASDIRIRGLSTIESDETPLIILDNFPYEGSIDHIDPNTIESVTVLKDAAASSIWGARAGNGVIVLTTKKPQLNRGTRITLNSDFNIIEKPDFMYSKDWLPSDIVMEIEKKRFGEGLYVFNDRQAISIYVDKLKRHQEGKLSDTELLEIESYLRNQDTRRSMMDHLYQNGLSHKTALNVSGGGEWQSFMVTASHNRSLGLSIGDKSQQNQLNIVNNFYPIKGLMLSLGLNYLTANAENNGIDFHQIHYSRPNTLSPYMTFANEHGKAMAIPQFGISSRATLDAEEMGLLDWQFRPLEDRSHRDILSNSSALILNTNLTYRMGDFLNLNALYQYAGNSNQSRTHYQKESYYVRDLVNKFTQLDGTQVIPHNGILSIGNPSETRGHSGRLQLDFDRSLTDKHQLNALVGGELRHRESHRFPGSILYNYDSDHLVGTNVLNYNQTYRQRPAGNSMRIPPPSASNRLLINRDLSFYSNMGYSFDNRYVLSASIRWDGSNLFGVKTNQKGVPLWSLGGVWNLSNESFMESNRQLNVLKLRGTYGIAGNVNKTLTHMPTVRYGVDGLTQLPSADLVSVGNPSLRWEQVRTLNVGVDWSLTAINLSGSVEWYSKQGEDLIGNDFMDPTTGISGEYKVNYANIVTQGMDVRLQSRYQLGGVSWRGVILSSWVRDKVTNYNTSDHVLISKYLGQLVPPVKGYSRDMLYSIPWHGLASDTGLPIVYIDGERSSNYQQYYSRYLDFPMLYAEGSQIPTWYGSLRNEFTFKGIEVSFMFSWKAGHVFRRSSIRPADEYSDIFHQDYLKRWEKPGDERVTGVPRYMHVSELKDYPQVGLVYASSSYLVERGDHIRWQDLRVAYTIPQGILADRFVKDFQLYGYAKNLGLLWSANKQGIDPDFVDAHYVAPRTFYLGVRVGF